jgi:hypothetical protein
MESTSQQWTLKGMFIIYKQIIEKNSTTKLKILLFADLELKKHYATSRNDTQRTFIQQQV